MNTITKITLATVISMALGTAAIADTAGDDQTVTIDIPSVKLLDIKNATGTSTADDQADNLTFTLTAPSVAGDNFGDATAQPGSFDITSNVAVGDTTKRKITVSADALGEGWKLGIDATGATAGTGASVSFTHADVSSKDLVTAIGNVAAKDNALSYTFGPETPTTVPAHTGGTTQDITLTFTLSDDA